MNKQEEMQAAVPVCGTRVLFRFPKSHTPLTHFLRALACAGRARFPHAWEEGYWHDNAVCDT